jgi:hypothetical protein
VKKGKLDGKLALTVTMEEVVPVTHAKDITAAVVCGSADQECISHEALEGHVDVKDVIPIYECPGGDQLAAMVACEAAVLATLTEKLAQSCNPKIQLLVLDESASFKMHQIFNNILIMEPAADEIFDSSFIAMTWSPDLTGQTWRKEFDRLRKLFKWDPAVRVELVLQAGVASLVVLVYSLLQLIIQHTILTRWSLELVTTYSNRKPRLRFIISMAHFTDSLILTIQRNSRRLIMT